MAETTRTGDEANTGFGIRTNVVQHKPGLDLAAEVKDNGAGNHRFRRRDRKDIPQGSLAERIAKSKKGD